MTGPCPPRALDSPSALVLRLRAGAPAARAGEKIAVLVLATADKDADLADNLTEVIIAYAAQHGGFEIAGKEEFRARLGVESERRTQACLDDIACLGRAGVSLGVRRIVAGSVGTRGKQVLFNLNLDNVQDGKVESRVFRLVEGGVENLIKAVQDGVERAVSPPRRAGEDPGRRREPAGRARRRSTTPTSASRRSISPTLRGRQAQRARRGDRALPLDLAGRGAPRRGAADPADPRQPAPRAGRWPANTAYASTALAAAAFATGRVSRRAVAAPAERRLARRRPWQDLEQKRRFALAANISFGAGAVLGAVALYHFLRYHDDIFGRTERYEDAP